MNTNDTPIHNASLHRRAFLRRSSTALGVMCLGHTLPAGAAETHPWLRSRRQVAPLAARPVPRDIEHVVIHRNSHDPGKTCLKAVRYIAGTSFRLR